MAKKYVAKKLNEKWFRDNDDLVKRFNKLSAIIERYCNYETSEGTLLNLMGWSPYIKKAIKHLPVYEQKFIMHKFNRFSKLKTALGGIKVHMRKDLGENYEVALEVRKAQILELYGLHYSSQEIHKKLIEESGLNISFTSIRRFYLKYKAEIEKVQLDYEKAVGQIGIARKRSRLEVLDHMLRKTKQDYDKVNGMRMLPYSREMAKILEQARKEVEGEQLHLNVDGTINIVTTIESAKSVEQLYSDINFMNLLIARVAARMRINPMMLQYQLTNSWYAKFTGIKRHNSLMDDVPNYPSNIILNWNDLQDKADKKEKELLGLKAKFTEDVEYVPVEKEVSKAEKLRDALRSKLKIKQEEIDKAKAKIVGMDKV